MDDTPHTIAPTTNLAFSTVREEFNSYTLGDGNQLRVKCVVAGVRRAAELGPDGKPVYYVDVNLVNAVDVREAAVEMKGTIQ